MTTQPIQFFDTQETSSQELAGASPLAVNVIVDRRGAVRRRPGIAAWSGFPGVIPEANSVSGIYGVGTSSLLHVCESTPGARTIYRTNAGASGSLGTTSAERLSGLSRPAFAETRWIVAMAGGLDVQKVDKSTWISSRLGGSPPACSNITAISQRLITDDDSSSSTAGWVRYSKTGLTGNEVWPPRYYFDTEADPDDVVRVESNTNELFCFCEKSLQVYSPDPVSIFAPGRTLRFGCAAQHGVVFDDGTAYVLDNRRRILQTDGRQYQDISGPIAADLDALTSVSDCWAFFCPLPSYDLYGWVFPTDGKTFVYHKGIGWSQWNGWTGNPGVYTAWPATAFHYWPQQNLNLVGLATGQVAMLDMDAYDDLGGTIKAEVKTGFINRGTDLQKNCKAVRLTVKRLTSSGKILLSWRDDAGDFGAPEEIDVTIGAYADYDVVIERRSLGVYRRRQWKVEFTDAKDLVLVSVEEDFDVLPS